MGVITYLLLCGFPPFYGESLEEVFDAISKGKFEFPDAYWGHISASAKDFIEHLLVVDPQKRLNASDALKHAWIQTSGNNSSTALSLKSDKCQKFNSMRLLSKASLK